MPNDAQPADASLEDLERRVAAFESATKRLKRTVGGDGDAPAAAAAVSAPGSGSSASRQAFSHNDEISGLRPAVPAAAPVTGALTARRRSSDGGGSPSPGFTSAYGKPAIPVMPAAVEAAPGMLAAAVATTRRRARHRPWWSRKRTAALLALAVTLLCLAVLTRLFREQPSAEVWAETLRCLAPVGGTVATVNAQVGGSVASGAPVARVGETVIAAPQDVVVMRLLATPGTRIAAGELIAELALPATLRVVVPLKPGGAVVGDRVSVRLLGEQRVVGGMVERVLGPNDPGWWNGGGTAPLRAAIVLDRMPAPPRLGQGARVTILGRDPGPLTLALFALRRMLPW